MQLRTMRRVAPPATVRIRRVGAPAVAAALWLAAVYGLLLVTGGRPNMLSALACLPIALGALAGGWRGGLLVAVGAMILYGPLTPVHGPEQGSATDLGDWLVRSAEFLTAGLLLGVFATRGERLAGLLAREQVEQTATHELATSEARLRTAFEGLVDGVLLFDADGRLTFANEAAERLLGLERAEMIGCDYPALASRAGLMPVTATPETAAQGWTIPAEATVGAGPANRLIALRAAPLTGSTPGGLVISLHEASAERALARQQAAHLEGLREVAAELVGAPSAVAAGTALLTQFGGAWPNVAAALYLFAGGGTERLAALWPGGPHVPLVPVSAAAALHALASGSPARLPLAQLPGPAAGARLLAARGAHSLLVLALGEGDRTIGVLLAGDRQPPEPLTGAEAAYLGRIARVAAGIVQRAVADEEAARLMGVAAIDAILARPTRLHPHFQPIVALNPPNVVGYEALARLHDAPPGGPPAWFAAAEASGRGAALQGLAIGRARAVAAAAGLPRGTFLAINVSPRYLTDPTVAAAFGKGSLRRLVIEVTEEEAVADYAALRSAMAPYRARGARFAVDDAGAGFASFRHVTEIGPDFIKLDAELVRNLRTSPARRALLRALAGFAAEVGATTIAEGVETSEDLDDLRTIGRPLLAQGYALARPGPPWPIVAPLRRARTRAAPSLPGPAV